MDRNITVLRRKAVGTEGGVFRSRPPRVSVGPQSLLNQVTPSSVLTRWAAYTTIVRNRGGFVLIATVVSLAALIGLLGLALDLGQLYIIRSEAQTFTDSTALRAARELDGSLDGLDRARQAVSRTPMRWAMNTQLFTGSGVEFSRDNRDFTGQPASASEIRFVRVTAHIEHVELFFLPAVISGRTAQVRTQSVAARQPVTTFSGRGPGLLPFAPSARNAHDPDFGFAAGEILTLRRTGGPGYLQGAAPEAIREAIEGGRVTMPVTLGQPVVMTGGSIELQAESLRQRANQDTNTTAQSYRQYLREPGNGRRIAVAPVVDARDNFRVTGFASVFLPVTQEAIRLTAEYIGPYPLEGSQRGLTATLGLASGLGAGAHAVRLVQ